MVTLLYGFIVTFLGLRYVFPNALQNYLFSFIYLLTRWHIFFDLYLFWHEPPFFAFYVFLCFIDFSLRFIDYFFASISHE